MDVNQIKNEFLFYIKTISKALGKEIEISDNDIIVTEPGCANHNRIVWEENCMYVYSFWYNGEVLKIGKAGPNSRERYKNHHYNSLSSKSCLARSLLIQGKSVLSEWGIDYEKELQLEAKTHKSSKSIKDSIKNKCTRIDVRLPFDSSIKDDIFKLELVEAILHYVYKPIFEGWENQR